jgi:hypothetical protein
LPALQDERQKRLLNQYLIDRAQLERWRIRRPRRKPRNRRPPPAGCAGRGIERAGYADGAAQERQEQLIEQRGQNDIFLLHQQLMEQKKQLDQAIVDWTA